MGLGCSRGRLGAGQMRQQLAAALRQQTLEESADVNALRRLHQKRSVNVFTGTVKTTKTVTSVLEDPKLPSKNDLGRWWPEPARGTLNPLVPFPTRPPAPNFERAEFVHPVGSPVPPSTAHRGSTVGLLPMTPGAMGSPPITAPLPRTASGPSLPRSASLPPATGATAKDGSPAQSGGGPGSGGLNGRVGKRPDKWKPRKRKATIGEPSITLGNPSSIELLAEEGAGAPDEDVFESLQHDSSPRALVQSQQLEALDRSTRLAHWMNAFAADEESFASKAVFVEMRLRQALSSSVSLGVPNTFRIAVVCDAFERVAPLTGRYEGVLVLIWKELIRSLFSDYTPDLPGAGAKIYAERTPFFLEAKRLRELCEAHERTMRRMKAQRNAELEAMKARNEVCPARPPRHAACRPPVCSASPSRPPRPAPSPP